MIISFVLLILISNCIKDLRKDISVILARAIMVDECLTKPCAVCGDTIQGAKWYCPYCKICICLTCGINMEELECPKCQKKLV